MQISELILYSRTGKQRRISFQLGKPNIITGRSRTGKSTIAALLAFCLGRSAFDVPEGPIRDSLDWCGVHVHFPNTELLIVRQSPPIGVQTSSTNIYLEVGHGLEFPEHGALHHNVNGAGLVEVLSGHLGIADDPEVRQYAESDLVVSSKHALFFSFQRQWELANPKTLFHRQGEEGIPQTIRDVLPFFLGATDPDRLGKRQQLRALRRDLASHERRLEQLQQLQQTGFNRAIALIAESTDVGFFEELPKIEEWSTAVEMLRRAFDPATRAISDLGEARDTLGELQGRSSGLAETLRLQMNQRDVVRSYLWTAEAYDGEGKEQAARLATVGLYPEALAGDADACPLCGGADMGDPTSAAIRTALDDLTERLVGVEVEAPRVATALESLEVEIERTRRDLSSADAALQALIQKHGQIKDIRDREYQRMYVLGRIASYLDELATPIDEAGLRSRIQTLRSAVESLDGELRDSTTRERVRSILNRVGGKMEEYAKSLQLEHQHLRLRIDPNRLTVAADTDNGPLYMDSTMGSGENWVGMHLSAHLALHDHFIAKARPVPRFLFLDQPSQVYQISEVQDQNLDRDALIRMFKLLPDFCAAHEGEFQIIAVDHAEFSDDWFQNMVAENWQSSGALIPGDWLSEEDSGE